MEQKENSNVDLKKIKPQDFTPEEIKKITAFLINILGYDPSKRPKIYSLIDLIKKI